MNFQGGRKIFKDNKMFFKPALIANSRKALGAQRCLATLAFHRSTYYRFLEKEIAATLACLVSLL